jgi:hypothetical protein
LWLLTRLQRLQFLEVLFEDVPEQPLEFGVHFVGLTEREALDQLADLDRRSPVVTLGVAGQVGVEELGEDAGLDGVDGGGRDRQLTKLAGLPEGLPDYGEELVFDAIVRSLFETGRNLLPTRTQLLVQLEEPQVVFLGPLLFGKVWVEVVVPAG